MRHILFGDSIGAGVGDYQNGGWATQLRLFIDRQKQSKDHNLINLSIAGDTTRALLARMEKEARLRMRDNSPAEFTFLLAIGTNDSRIHKTDVNKNISLVEFKANIQELIETAQTLSSEVVLIGLLPVDECRTTPFKEDKYYTVKQLEMYNDVLLAVAAKKRLRMVNFFPEWKKVELASFFVDGLHPNTAGHSKMFEKIKQELF